MNIKILMVIVGILLLITGWILFNQSSSIYGFKDSYAMTVEVNQLTDQVKRGTISIPNADHQFSTIRQKHLSTKFMWEDLSLTMLLWGAVISLYTLFQKRIRTPKHRYILVIYSIVGIVLLLHVLFVYTPELKQERFMIAPWEQLWQESGRTVPMIMLLLLIWFTLHNTLLYINLYRPLQALVSRYELKKGHWLFYFDLAICVVGTIVSTLLLRAEFALVFIFWSYYFASLIRSIKQVHISPRNSKQK